MNKNNIETKEERMKAVSTVMNIFYNMSIPYYPSYSHLYDELILIDGQKALIMPEFSWTIVHVRRQTKGNTDILFNKAVASILKIMEGNPGDSKFDEYVMENGYTITDDINEVLKHIGIGNLPKPVNNNNFVVDPNVVAVLRNSIFDSENFSQEAINRALACQNKDYYLSNALSNPSMQLLTTSDMVSSMLFGSINAMVYKGELNTPDTMDYRYPDMRPVYRTDQGQVLDCTNSVPVYMYPMYQDMSEYFERNADENGMIDPHYAATVASNMMAIRDNTTIGYMASCNLLEGYLNQSEIGQKISNTGLTHEDLTEDNIRVFARLNQIERQKYLETLE